MGDKTRKQQLEEMLAEDGSDPFLHYGLAMEFVAAGEDDQAVQRFDRLFTVAPDYVPAYLQAGQALVRLRRIIDARGVFERGISTAKRLGDAHAAEEMQGMLMNLA